jgi:hypothetical protein
MVLLLTVGIVRSASDLIGVALEPRKAESNGEKCAKKNNNQPGGK